MITSGLASNEYTLHLCVYRLTIHCIASQLLSTGQLDYQVCDVKFVSHSHFDPLRIKTFVFNCSYEGDPEQSSTTLINVSFN